MCFTRGLNLAERVPNRVRSGVSEATRAQYAPSRSITLLESAPSSGNKARFHGLFGAGTELYRTVPKRTERCLWTRTVLSAGH